MNIAIFFNISKSNGGVYQYSLSFLNSFKEDSHHHYFILNTSPDFPHQKYKQIKQFTIINLYDQKSSNRSLLKLIQATLKSLLLNSSLATQPLLLKKVFSKATRLLHTNNIDLVFFPAPSLFALITPMPFIISVHDLQHRLQPHFSEVGSHSVGRRREKFYQEVTRRAYKILADSTIGKEDITKLYNVPPHRIVVLPYLPPNYLKRKIAETDCKKIQTLYNLPPNFLFYPAQFWPHKNHKNLVEALGWLKEKYNLEIPIVLCGSPQTKWGEFQRVIQLVKKLKLDKQFLYLGYIPNKHINILYKLATALVMPTFFGPTNIPILEAWYLECPVLYSNIRGCREQANGAALLFNPADPQDIANKIMTLWENQNLQKDLIIKGHVRLKKWTKHDFSDRILKIITSFENEKSDRKNQTQE